MLVSEALGINQNNHLTIGGCDCIDLVKQYGTPLYVMDEVTIRNNCTLYRESINRFYDGRGLVLYASKAFCTKAMCKIIAEEQMGLDVVSGGELYTALQAGFPTEKIYFHGNNKTPDELEMALQNKVGRIVVDNVQELRTLSQMAQNHNTSVKILFRIKPGIDAHTHDFVQTGQIDSKFGVALETGEAMAIIQEANQMPFIEVVGVHCHIGSQIFDREPFESAASIMMNFIADVKDQIGLEIAELNLGGGYGIQYVQCDDPVPYDSYIKVISKIVKQIAQDRGLTLPFILMEPGRSITAPAGITLYTVGNIKTIPGIRTYVSVNGGMADNPRYALYQSQYHAVLANRGDDPIVDRVTIAGKCCESGDLLIKDIPMPEMKPGDILAILATGAYNYSMSSNYNRIPRPPVVMVRNGVSRVVVKRETYEDLLRNDL